MMPRYQDAVKKIRRLMCLEKAELAKKLGTHRQTVYYHEKGIKRPKLPMIRSYLNIAHESGIPELMALTPDDFLEDD